MNVDATVLQVGSQLTGIAASCAMAACIVTLVAVMIFVVMWLGSYGEADAYDTWTKEG